MHGSPAWIKATYEGDAARSVLGRSRPTQRNVSVDKETLAQQAVEGRLENTSLHLLEWLRNIGTVKRFKSQPFTLKKELHGIDATPDFMFEDYRTLQYVMEVKPLSRLTPAEQNQQDQVARVSELAQMKFLIWTDQWPLTRTAFLNLWHMRRAQKLGYSASDIAEVAQAVDSGHKTVKDLYEGGLTFDVIHAAAYRGRVFLNIFHPINEQSYVHRDTPPRIIDELLQGWCRADLAWERLSSA
ncbi:hypothetical protein [Variovorax sp. E3]|uniref:hypothetical protein n=1 Tax=Variovorax sp. E3 TaxID=1914993 RepID=UPI0018DDF23A|nr:hypothetical protein [Variovorax sp. E3]